MNKKPHTPALMGLACLLLGGALRAQEVGVSDAGTPPGAVGAAATPAKVPQPLGDTKALRPRPVRGVGGNVLVRFAQDVTTDEASIQESHTLPGRQVLSPRRPRRGEAPRIVLHFDGRTNAPRCPQPPAASQGDTVSDLEVPATEAPEGRPDPREGGPAGADPGRFKQLAASLKKSGI